MTGPHPSALPYLFQEELYLFSNPVLVILPKPWESYGSSEQTLLQKILTSVKIDMDTVQIVVLPSADLESLKVFSPSRVLIFGGNTADHLPFYKETTAQGFMAIRAEDLSLLDDQKKKNLWLALRQMFGV